MYSMKRSSAPSVSGVVQQRDHLIVVHAADDDGVHLEPGEAWPRRPRGRPGRRSSSSNRASCLKRSRSSVSRLTVTPMQAGALEIRRGALQEHAVGRHRQIADAIAPASRATRSVDVAAEQRLAARQPHLVHAEIEEQVDQLLDLLEMEDVLARQPEILLLRHAVEAAQVASVGDREPQVPERPAVDVGDCHPVDHSGGPGVWGAPCVRMPACGCDRSTCSAGSPWRAWCIVNNPGDWNAVYWPLLHAEWHGWTPTDLIFPFFLFIVGAAIPLGSIEGRSWPRVWRRTAVIVGLGWFLAGFPFFRLATIRIPGVLVRIGLCYLAAASLVRLAGDDSRKRRQAFGSRDRGAVGGLLVPHDPGAAARRGGRRPLSGGQPGGLAGPHAARRPPVAAGLGSRRAAEHLAGHRHHAARRVGGCRSSPGLLAARRRPAPCGLGARGCARGARLAHAVPDQQGALDELLRPVHRRRRGRRRWPPAMRGSMPLQPKAAAAAPSPSSRSGETRCCCSWSRGCWRRR